MAPEGIAVIGLQADLGFLPPPEPSLKPKAEERQSVEEPAGGPAADPKARTSRTATSPGRATVTTTRPPEVQHPPWAERRRRPRGHRLPQSRAEPGGRWRRPPPHWSLGSSGKGSPPAGQAGASGGAPGRQPATRGPAGGGRPPGRAAAEAPPPHRSQAQAARTARPLLRSGEQGIGLVDERTASPPHVTRH